MTQKKTAAVKMPAAMPVHTVLARVLDGPDKGAVWEGDRGSIGSAKDNALTLGDPTVSGYHVELIAEKSGIRVADLGSTNGTWIDERRRIRASHAAPGDPWPWLLNYHLHSC